MEAQSYTAQERRAANQVWAAAGAYGFEPLFLARYTDGTTDFYMNTIVGLVHKYYGDTLIRSIFDSWEGDMRQSLLDDLTWLYLESAAYRRELPSRPVLESLRRVATETVDGMSAKKRRDEGDVCRTVRSAVSSYLYKHTKRSPMIIPMVTKL